VLKWVLLNNGVDFPITGEPKYFIEGQSFILKHILKYNLYNTSSNSAVTSKIIFTDYEIAKKQLPVNSSLYQDINFSFSDTVPFDVDYFQITHHHDSFIIRTGVTSDRYYAGYASQISNNSDPISGGTTVAGIFPFVANVDDYIRIDIMSGTTTYLTMKTNVKLSGDDTLVLKDLIPNRILNYTSDMTFELYNYNIATDWTTAISQLNLNSPYSKFYTVTDNVVGTYHNLTIVIKIIDGGISQNFNSLNNYITYDLYTRLNLTNPAIFTATYSFFDTFTTNNIVCSYIDRTRIKLSFMNSSEVSNFREFTYVEVSGGGGSYNTLIWEIDGDDVYIEKPYYYSYGTSITSISNIDGLSNISDILQEVFINVDYDWYISKKDNIRRRICSQYAQLLSEDVVFTRNVTGLLYENEFNEFVLKLYDLENDSQLNFSTIELMYLGADRKIRLPVPIKRDRNSFVVNDSSTIDGLDRVDRVERIDTFTSDWNILDDGLIYTGATDTYSSILDYSLLSTNTTDDVLDFGLNVVLGGVNDPPLMFNIIDGNDN